MALTITDNASLQIKEMMQDEDQATVHLRFGVKGGGCSGLSYSMGFDYDITDKDETYELNGIPIVVNKEDIPIIKGTKIDFKQNMMGGGFTIDNPNAIVSCGCGTSFKTATNTGTPENC
ncbi:iron-sulfur cluster assembly protein [Salirhabdus euzebyi]|uniref:Iron-sulfur cluster assembly protein n=1 Tax=Salirhabdus euzebyi TaxID=394506 RepID=A0A841Q4R0_9BACI|nr:iron-sulfur cluster assembly accessory protein [Salirhabdus euzebyi]MBB6453429.1 iron-sulfur cluster assembly protein [Salirhabdus euzebyi]